MDSIVDLAGKLKSQLEDLKEIEEMQLNGENDLKDNELAVMSEEYKGLCASTAGKLYKILLDKGYLNEEFEDNIDLAILEFIDYAGPEYAWRLGINLGLHEAEARRRLNMLLEKGLLERVEGTMLDNYHREKDWTKHMNHTYYKMSREGRLYLRRLKIEK